MIIACHTRIFAEITINYPSERVIRRGTYLAATQEVFIQLQPDIVMRKFQNSASPTIPALRLMFFYTLTHCF